MVPSGSPLVGIADRAGYPVLTVPAGFGAENSSTGGDPIGVDFIGTAFSEAAAPRRRLRLRTGTQSTPDRARLHGVHRQPRTPVFRGPERDQPEHVAVRAGERVLQAL